MPTFYAIDTYTTHLRRRNAYLDSKVAEEKAVRYACALGRPISVFEINNERESEWPMVAQAKQYWGMATPYGDFVRSKNGENPYAEYLNEMTTRDKHENPEYHEDRSFEGLKMRVKASLEEVKKVSAANANEVYSKADVQTLISHVESLQSSLKKAATLDDAKINMLLGAHKQSSHNVFDLIEVADRELLARMRTMRTDMVPASKQKISASESDKAQADHLKSGDIALLDKKDKAFILEPAEGVYVALVNGSVTQVPDDAVRLVKLENDPQAKEWGAFLRVLLKQQGVNAISDLDSEQKTRVYDLARRKWAKVSERLAAKHSAPAKPAPKQEATSASLSKICFELCKNDFEAASKLEDHVRASFKDSTKAHAMNLLKTWGTYHLPKGWYDSAKASVDTEKKIVAARKLSALSLVPPVAVRAEAAKVAVQSVTSGAKAAEYTARLSKSIASGTALSMADVERLGVFFASADKQSKAYASFGGATCEAWIESLSREC